MKYSINLPTCIAQNYRTWLLGMLLLISGVAHAAQQAAPYTHATRYDFAGRVTGTISPDPDGSGPIGYPATRNTYNSSTGQLVKAEEGELVHWMNETIKPSNWTNFVVRTVQTFNYDSSGRLKFESTESNTGQPISGIQYSYTQYDLVECRAVRINPTKFDNLPNSACDLGPSHYHGSDRITRFEYTHTTRQVQKEYRAYNTPLQQVYKTNHYDSIGRLSGVTDANGNYTEFRYDSHNRLGRQVYPSKTQTGVLNESDYQDFWYDDNGNMTQERKRDGTLINYTYDKLNRMVHRTRPDNTQKNVSYEYDLRGLQLKASAAYWAEGSISNTYDGFGRLTRQGTSVFPNSFAVDYQYDKNGNRTGIVYPDGMPFFYEYDQLNRLTAIVGNGDNLIEIQYPNRSDYRKRVTRLNGVTTTIDYDMANRVESIEENLAGTAHDNRFGFAYSAANQMTQLTVSNSHYRQSLGNASTGQYAVNGLNQYTQAQGATGMAYGPNGNLTRNVATTYTYDVENRLTNVGSYDPNGKTASIDYDPLGRLRYLVPPSGTIYFSYSGDALIGEYNSARAMTKRYVHGPGMDQPLIEYDGESLNSPLFLHRNHQGSVIAASDVNGNKAYINSYDAYGIPGDNNQGRFGYTGQIWLYEVDLYHYKARVYDPEIGRFLQTDPIGYEDQMNLYAYVGNDPLNNTDPTGKALCGGACIGALIVAGAREGAKACAKSSGCRKSVADGVRKGAAVIEAITGVFNESSDSSSTENKGQGQSEVGDCPSCGGDTSNKPGKIGQEHGIKTKEAKNRIEEIKQKGKLEGNPDVEVCNDCGEVFPQTESGGLGDSIGNIEDT